VSAIPFPRSTFAQSIKAKRIKLPRPITPPAAGPRHNISYPLPLLPTLPPDNPDRPGTPPADVPPGGITSPGSASESVAPGVESLEISPGQRPRRAAAGLTPDGRLKSGRLAGLTMGGAILAIAWPVLVDSILNSLVGLTDTVLAAGMSEAAADAIGTAAYNLWFVGLFFIALDVGATALISRSIGAGRLAVANAALGQTMLLALVAGVALGFFVALLTDPVARLVGMPPEAAHAFRTYMHIVAFDVPFMSLLLAGIACLRGAGDTFLPMRAMVIVNIVNALASWALAGVDLRQTRIIAGEPVVRTILHNPFDFDMGVAGLALGTLLGHATGAAIILFTLSRGTHGLRLLKRRLRPHGHTMRRIVRVGLPNFYETLGMWAGNYLILLIVAWLGPGLVGAHNLAIRIEAFSFQPGFAMGIAAAALAGQYLGAGSPQMARRAILTCAAIASIIMGLAGLVFVLRGQQVVGMLSSQPTHLGVTPRCLFITGLVQVPFAVALVFRQAMRGAGDVKAVMWITWVTTYAARLPLAYALSGVDIPIPASLGGGVLKNPFGLEPSLAGLWIGLCAEIVIRAGIFTARFLHGGWSRQRV
jgi:putative MATE family efflux protein